MFKSVSWRTRFSNIFLEIIVAALVILWIYTSISKLYDYENFRTQLGRSPFLENISTFTANVLPVGELLLALLLIIRKTRVLGLYLSFGLMLMFTGYIYIMLYYSYDLPCSCGGVLAQMSWDNHLYFNIGYTLLALIGILIIEKGRLLQHSPASR